MPAKLSSVLWLADQQTSRLANFSSCGSGFSRTSSVVASAHINRADHTSVQGSRCIARPLGVREINLASAHINRADHTSVQGSHCIARPLGVREINLASAHINWADHTSPTTIQDVGVNHRRFHIGMTEQLLHGSNVITGFQKVRRE